MSDPNYGNYQPVPGQQGQPQYQPPPQYQASQPPPQQYYQPVPPPGAPGYPPPGGAYVAPMYAPIQQGQQVVSQPTTASWTNTPQVAYCSSCNSQGVTNVMYTPGACTWLSCVGICLIGCYLGCCLIPFCVNGLQDCVHRCSNCGAVLGRKNII